MKVLGIETSCDETGVAIYDSQNGLLACALHSQIQEHAKYGGVVPELASRDHIQKLYPLVEQTLEEAGLGRTEIDGVAYTAGPGLMGALFVGACFGRSLAWALGKPSIGVHHMEGHLLAPMLEDDAPEYPFLALLVSGGHTLLVQVTNFAEYEILGESVDDAAGEAFDKTARVLGLGYPGGAELSKLAEQGEPGRFVFPRPMTDRPGLDFSFSGLKTHALNTFQKHAVEGEQTKADIAHAFQTAVIDTLRIKCQRAIEATGLNRLVVAGGVSANRVLRAELEKILHRLGGRVYFPRPEFCTDNGAMIAYAGYCRLQAGFHDGLAIQVKPRWPLTDIDDKVLR